MTGKFFMYWIILLLMGLLALGATGYWYFGHVDLVNEKDITTLKGLVIAQSVSSGSTGGNRRTTFQVFRFKGLDNDFRFSKDYYKYAAPAINFRDYRTGDTVSIQIINKTTEMVNLSKGSGFIIDHEKRNSALRHWHTKAFMYSGLFVGVLIILAVGRQGFNYLKRG